MSIGINLQESYRNDVTEMQFTNLAYPICDQEQSDKLHENLARPFKCQQCDLTFDRASQRDYHYRSIHLAETSQLCDICCKGFFMKADLVAHLDIHLTNNTSICEVCGKKFNHLSNLIMHSRLHAGIKPYPCSICSKRFTQISSLARHERTHIKPENDVHEAQSNSANTTAEKKDHILSKNMVPQNYNASANISLNVTDMFQEIDLSESSIDEHDKLDLTIQNHQEINEETANLQGNRKGC